MSEAVEDYTAVVIGTGFGGAVTACRLAQAQIKTCVLERGRRYERNDFPTYPTRSLEAEDGPETGQRGVVPPPDFSRWMWRAGQGLWDIRDLGKIVVAQAAGYGGGSLIYASVHLRPPASVFDQLAACSRARSWPKEYSRQTLDPYFDLAAFMLDVQVPPEVETLDKTLRFKEAAEALGRDGQWFQAPLAVRFDERPGADGAPERNRWGREQSGCDLRGYCTLGCRRQAKNTLDLNYLTLAEENGAEVRTLAEVKGITRAAEGSPENVRFRVRYEDHLNGGRMTSLDAECVFLCAGAVNTTELIFRDAEGLGVPCEARKYIGKAFHPNADSLAMVFDTKKPQRADRGPTITSGLVYEGDEHWYLVEDGGFPADLEPLLGVFRSPLLLRRNRYIDRGPGAGWSGSEPSSGLPSFAPVGLLREGLRGLPFSGLPLSVLAPPLGGNSKSLLQWPKWLKDALKGDRDELVSNVANAAEDITEELFRTLATELEKLIDDLPEEMRRGVGEDLIEQELVLGALRLGAQLLWGSETEMARKVAQAATSHALTKDFLEAASVVLGWVLAYGTGGGRSGVLLIMGRDQEPGQLWFDKELPPGRQLWASFEDARHRVVRREQGRILRDIARVWGGELRTNPLSFFGERQVTVHSQGGCAMGRVTEPSGQVIGCGGLYVMDGAAFPSSVGINPSATILAVAEYKVERFIRDHLDDETWRVPRHEDFDDWCDQLDERVRDPLSLLRQNATAAESVLAGLTFKEQMSGTHSAFEAEYSEVRPDGWATVKKGILAQFTDAELFGTRAADCPVEQEITLDLTATVDDLGAFLDAYNLGQGDRPRIDLSGTVRMKGWPSRGGEYEVEASSYLQLFVDRPGDDTSGQPAAFLYVIRFEVDSVGAFEELPAGRYVLRGAKVLCDELGFDVWQDTSTLYFDLLAETRTGERPLRRGILRLALNNFVKYQLPSFDVPGINDSARKTWAFSAFGKFFLQRLVNVYGPSAVTWLDGFRKFMLKIDV